VSAIQFHLGVALHRADRLDEALEMYEGALASVTGVGPANTVQYALAGAGAVVLQLGDAERAVQLFAESHAVARQLGAEGNPRAAVGEGLLARERGDLVAARERLTFALRLLAGSNEPEWCAAALVALGHVAEADGDLDDAERSHRRAEEVAPGWAAALDGLACVAVARGSVREAAGLLGAAAVWRRRRHRPAGRIERSDAARAEHRARTVLGDAEFDAEFDAAFAAGLTRPADAPAVPR
jgi:tetratricopeptide (TPR) repeat protein